MKKENKFIGSKGEDIAKSFLIENGYSIISSNYWEKFGEIDLITTDPEGVLVFVEVKTLRDNGSDLRPEDNLSSAKIRKLKKICQFYANKNETLIKNGWRIDAITISIKENYLTIKSNNYLINHYENI